MAVEVLEKRVETAKWMYGYTLKAKGYEGLLKVGETNRPVEARVREQVAAIKLPKRPYEILFKGSAMRPDGTTFSDHDHHRALKAMGCVRVEGEWFRCTPSQLKAAYTAVFARQQAEAGRTESFAMREEQREAVERTVAYFRRTRAADPSWAPRFLWNAKMRFGKTFATYQLARAMGFKRVLVLTFKPAVMSAWEEDLRCHADFAGWTFIRRYEDRKMPSTDEQFAAADKGKPIVCFGSLQDFLGYDRETGGIKAKNAWVHELNWDLVVFDEYHFGAWRERAQQLFEREDEDLFEGRRDFDSEVRGNNLDERDLPITTGHYLFLSGTPFRILTTGEFTEDAIFSWTYTDEQQRKASWKGPGENPYAALPVMKLRTYRLPEEIRRIAEEGEQNEFDLNTFFATETRDGVPRFVFEQEVGYWLDFLCGKYLPTVKEGLKTKARPPLPYSDASLLSLLQHSLWFLPDVASCEAMRDLLERHPFFRGFEVVLCAGKAADNGAKALEPLYEALGNPLETRTITLSCGKLTTGVTVRPWGGILMLRNLKSPETYFQAAFRVQSPWVTTDEAGRPLILKEMCYVLDSAPNRALRQVAEYAGTLTIDYRQPGADTPERRVGDFIHFLPILYHNGAEMRRINATEVLDLAQSGTTASLLARRWESALLVNVDNATLQRLLDHPTAWEVLQKIEGFRNLNKDDVTLLVNRTKAIKKTKRTGKKTGEREKRKLSEEEKEYKNKRRRIQEKLIKFATRIPIFMYLTDDREHSLKEVIAQVETVLFERVTGLTLKDFGLLLSLGVFNDRVMNAAVLNFKRYEDASLSYTGIDRHAGNRMVGAWDTALPKT